MIRVFVPTIIDARHLLDTTSLRGRVWNTEEHFKHLSIRCEAHG
jgi:hypothetical protein